MGSINTLLSNNPCKFSTMQIVHMLRGVACGMQYLSEESFIHKAIMGSNILVTKSQVCKVAGFDVRTRMEEQLFANNGESEILEAMAPWCAIEVLSSRLFSSAGDVWAFACLMWECLSNGQQPLAGCSSVEVCSTIEILPIPWKIGIIWSRLCIFRRRGISWIMKGSCQHKISNLPNLGNFSEIF